MDVLVDHANVVGISGDNEFCKLAWKQDNELIGNIRHSLAGDCGLGLSHTLGIVDADNGVCYRATFIFDKDRSHSTCIYQCIRHWKKCTGSPENSQRITSWWSHWLCMGRR